MPFLQRSGESLSWNCSFALPRLHIPHDLPCRAKTSFSEWPCPTWTGEMCPDGKETSCKRGAKGADGEGLACIRKRCVCQENSCYIAQTGQCVQDGCHVPVAQVAAIQAVGGISSPNAQSAAIRAGHQIEEQSILQQKWMPPKKKETEAVRYFWSAKLMETADAKKAESETLAEELTKSTPTENKPLTKGQVEELEKVLPKKLSNPDLMKELQYRKEEKVAYFWTKEAKKWVEAMIEKNKVTVQMFDPVKDKHHMESGQPVSPRQLGELEKLGGDNPEYDWRKESAGKFTEEERVKATYRWKPEGIAMFKGDDFKKVYDEVVAMSGPIRRNAAVQDLAVNAFEDRYGTMDLANHDGTWFSKEDEASKTTLDAANDNQSGLANSSNAKAIVVPQVMLPRYESGLPVILGQGSKTQSRELQGLESTMGRLSEKLGNLADHRIDIKEPEEEEQAMPSLAIIAASFTPALPRSGNFHGQRQNVLLKERWSAFFPCASMVAQ